jgi:hypothetical protein
MFLFLDSNGCVTSRDNAVNVVFGVPDWIVEDIKEYGTKYCCRYGGPGPRTGEWDYVGYVRCEGMGGARSFSIDAFPCIDGDGRAFVLNRDSIFGVKLPLVCVRRSRKGRLMYEALVDRYRNLIEIAKRIKCNGHCVLDEYGSVAVVGSDLFNVIDNWVKSMKSKAISLVSVLV